MLNINYENVAVRLIEQIPEFTQTYKNHLEYNDGEALPHILFGELVIFTAKICQRSAEAGDVHAQVVLDRIFDFIEDAANCEDKDVINLVMVSYMENIPKPGLTGPYGEFIKAKLKPKSRELLHLIDEFWDNTQNHSDRV